MDEARLEDSRRGVGQIEQQRPQSRSRSRWFFEQVRPARGRVQPGDQRRNAQTVEELLADSGENNDSAAYEDRLRAKRSDDLATHSGKQKLVQTNYRTRCGDTHKDELPHRLHELVPIPI